MKFRTISAITGAVAIVSTSVLGVAASASAETTVDLVTFYGASDFGVEDGGYPAGADWFFGDVSGPEGPHSFTDTGLVLNDPATGKVQILNQNAGSPATSSELGILVDNTNVYAQNDDWYFQLAFYAEGASETGFTTLRPANPGEGGINTSMQWTTSRAFGSFSAGETASWGDLVLELYAGETPRLLAYGVFVDATQSTVINGIFWSDHGSSFGLQPTRTISPNPITPEAFSTAGQGLTLSGTNWFPGTAAYIKIFDDDGNEIYSDASNFVVGTDGTLTVQIVLGAVPAEGTYYVTFDDDGLYYETELFQHYTQVGNGDEDAEGLLLSVSAAAPPQPEPEPGLAETGAEALPVATGGILVLLLGGAALILARRRAHSS